LLTRWTTAPPLPAQAFPHHFRGVGGDTPDDENLRILLSLTQQIADSDEPGPVLQPG